MLHKINGRVCIKYSKKLDKEYNLQKIIRQKPKNTLIHFFVNHKTLNSQKKIWHQNCLVLFKSAHCVLNIRTYTVLSNSLQRWKRSCTYKQFIIIFNIGPKLQVQKGRNSKKNDRIGFSHCDLNIYKAELTSCACKKTQDRLTEGWMGLKHSLCGV